MRTTDRDGHDASQGGRAALFAVAAVLAAALGLGAAWWVAQPPSDLGQFDRLAGEIGCTCGTCPLRPIATCGCGFADTMLAELEGLVAEDHTDDEIMVAFAASYGEQIRIAPASSGIDLTAWAAPMLLLTVGAVAMAGLIARWVASTDEDPVAGEGTAPEPARDTELHAQIERELEEMDGP